MHTPLAAADIVSLRWHLDKGRKPEKKVARAQSRAEKSASEWRGSVLEMRSA
jgi:hypothetical protein